MILLRVIAVLVGATGITHGVQAFFGAQPGGDPLMLVGEHTVVCVLGLFAAYGLWRGLRWAPAALAVFGLVVAALIVSLGPLLSLPRPARSGLWSGAVVLLVITGLAVWYAQRRIAASQPLRASG